MALAFDYLDRRMLGAVLLTDSLGQSLPESVQISCDDADIWQKKPGELIVRSARDLDGHDRAFEEPPMLPAIGSQRIDVDIRAGSSSYLSRRFALNLPLDPDPANKANDNSLFQHQRIVMPPSPSAQVAGGSAALLVRVTRASDDHAIEGAVVRVRPSGTLPEVTSLTNAIGEAMLIIAAVPLSSPGAGATVTSDYAAQVDAIIDPALIRFHAPEDYFSALQEAGRRQRDFIDPDDVVSRLSGAATTQQAIQLASGKTRSALIEWTPP